MNILTDLDKKLLLDHFVEMYTKKYEHAVTVFNTMSPIEINTG